MFYIPLTSTPLGWLILGLGGMALYKSGRKKGAEESAAALITAAPPLLEAEDETKDIKEDK